MNIIADALSHCCPPLAWRCFNAFMMTSSLIPYLSLLTLSKKSSDNQALLQMTVVLIEGICLMCMNMPQSSPSPEMRSLPFLTKPVGVMCQDACCWCSLRALAADSPWWWSPTCVLQGRVTLRAVILSSQWCYILWNMADVHPGERDLMSLLWSSCTLNIGRIWWHPMSGIWQTYLLIPVKRIIHMAMLVLWMMTLSKRHWTPPVTEGYGLWTQLHTWLLRWLSAYTPCFTFTHIQDSCWTCCEAW